MTEGPATDPPKKEIEGTDSVLAAYAAHIATCAKPESSDYTPTETHGKRGAILLAVIGGSLSEGINFADRLGRGVVVVGLPFPNPHSPEWRAKMEFVERRAQTISTASPGSGTAKPGSTKESAAREFYENACMRAVNQSIGRAIRHKGDYAVVMLFDRRYHERESIRNKLPGWMKESLVIGSGGRGCFDETVGRLRAFFTEREEGIPA